MSKQEVSQLSSTEAEHTDYPSGRFESTFKLINIPSREDPAPGRSSIGPLADGLVSSVRIDFNDRSPVRKPSTKKRATPERGPRKRSSMEPSAIGVGNTEVDKTAGSTNPSKKQKREQRTCNSIYGRAAARRNITAEILAAGNEAGLVKRIRAVESPPRIFAVNTGDIRAVIDNLQSAICGMADVRAAAHNNNIESCGAPENNGETPMFVECVSQTGQIEPLDASWLAWYAQDLDFVNYADPAGLNQLDDGLFIDPWF